MNREIFPGGIYPLQGDVTSQAGSSNVTVTGIQTTPVMSQAPQEGQILIFDKPTGMYVPGDPIVSGPDAVGDPSTRNPVQIGGVKGGTVYGAIVDQNGNLYIASPVLQEFMQLMLQELRAIRNAIIALDNTLNPADFDSVNYTDETNTEVINQ